MAELDNVTIEIPITAEGVMGLKQSCQTLISAYQKYSLSQVQTDENAIYPSLLPMISGMKTDAKAGVNAFESYKNISLDDMDRPSKSLGELNSYKDIESITGNYPISQSIYDEAKAEADKILEGMKGDEVPAESEELGGSFNKNDSIDKLPQEAITSSKIPNSIFLAEPFVGSGSSSVGNPEYKRTTNGRFKNSIQRKCIPCDLRLHGPDGLEVLSEFRKIWEEFLGRLQEMIDKLKDMLNNNDILDDICSLLNFLDFQCVPDLFSLLALLAALVQKYSDIIPNIDGLFNAFLGNFFSPILGGLSELLDRYIQMIMGPVDCVLNSLDTQLAKLDIQKGLRKFDTEALSFHRKREAYLRNKIQQLQERRAYLVGLEREGADPNQGPPVRIGGQPRSSQSNPLRNAIETDPTTTRSKSFDFSVPGARTISEEIKTLNEDISETQQKYNAEYGESGKHNLSKMYRENMNPTPTVIQSARSGMRDFRQGLYSSLFYVRQEAMNARRIVNDTLQVFQAELQRIIFGRAQTAEEQFEGARNLQRITRIISIIRTLINIKSLVKDGNLCDNTNGDPSLALGSFMSTYKNSEPAANNHKFYKSSDGSTLLVAPSDAVLELIDPETESVTQVDDLEEVEKLNKDGLPKDIGDISNKKVSATSADLGITAPVSVLKLDLCTNSLFSTQPDIDKIMSWAENAGL